MRIFEIAIPYHKELNPKLWNKNKTLKPEVLTKLREIAAAFIKFLDVPLKVDDIVLIGSCANYNWTSQSDIDLHLVMDVEKMKLECKGFTEELFDAKNDVWKDRHEVEIYGFPVEVYMQDNVTNKDKVDGIERHITGIFSIKDNKWTLKPTYSPPTINDSAVTAKASQFKRKIDKVIQNDLGYVAGKALMKRLKAFRKAGLEENGEFSVENLVFKELRNSSSIEKLLDYNRQSYANKLSLK